MTLHAKLWTLYNIKIIQSRIWTNFSFLLQAEISLVMTQEWLSSYLFLKDCVPSSILKQWKRKHCLNFQLLGIPYQSIKHCTSLNVTFNTNMWCYLIIKVVIPYMFVLLFDTFLYNYTLFIHMTLQTFSLRNNLIFWYFNWFNLNHRSKIGYHLIKHHQTRTRDIVNSGESAIVNVSETLLSRSNWNPRWWGFCLNFTLWMKCFSISIILWGGKGKMGQSS